MCVLFCLFVCLFVVIVVVVVVFAVIDHGVAGIELIMEEALQDIPPLVHDIQERLKGQHC